MSDDTQPLLQRIFLDDDLKLGQRPHGVRLAWHMLILVLAVVCVFLTMILRAKDLTFPGEHAVFLIIDLVFLLDMTLRIVAHETRQGMELSGTEQRRGWERIRSFFTNISMRFILDVLATFPPLIVDVGIWDSTWLEFLRVLRVYRMVSRKDALFFYAKQMYTEHRFVQPDRVPGIKKRMDNWMLGAAFISSGLLFYEMRSNQSIPWIDVSAIAFDLLFILDYSLRAIFSGHSSQPLPVRKGSNEGDLHFGVRWFLTRLVHGWRKSWNNYLSRWYGILDLMAWLFPVAFHVFSIGLQGEQFTRMARVFRIMRTFRLLRLLRALRWVRETMHFKKSITSFLRAVNKELLVAIIAMLFLIAAGTLYLMEFEGPVNAKFQEPMDAFYWSLMSVFGQPEDGELAHPLSRFIGIGILFCGIIATGLVTGSITTYIINRMDSRLMGKERITITDHIVICGYNSRLSELIQQMFAGSSRVDTIVVLFDRDNEKEDIIGDLNLGDDESGTSRKVIWVKGNPRSSADLEKTGVEHARSAIILADETKGLEDEEDRDALSLMTLEVISDYLEDRKKHHAVHVEGGVASRVVRKIGAARMVRKIGAARMKWKHSEWNWRALTGEEEITFIGDTKGRPAITIELLCGESVRVAKRLKDHHGRNKVDHIVYADDLVCKYITLENAGHGVADVYDHILDPVSVHIVHLHVDVTGFTDSELDVQASLNRREPDGRLLEAVKHGVEANGLLFMGLRIPARLLWGWLRAEDATGGERQQLRRDRAEMCKNDEYLLPKINELCINVTGDRAMTIDSIVAVDGLDAGGMNADVETERIRKALNVDTSHLTMLHPVQRGNMVRDLLRYSIRNPERGSTRASLPLIALGLSAGRRMPGGTITVRPGGKGQDESSVTCDVKVVSEETRAESARAQRRKRINRMRINTHLQVRPPILAWLLGRRTP